MSNPLLSIEHLNKSFFATRAVHDVSFTVEQGEIVSLLGENGAGKSTVIKMLAGVYKPDSGRMLLNGVELDASGTRSRISFIHQNLGLIEWMTVAENMALTLGYPRKLGLIDSGELFRRTVGILQLVGGGIDPDARIFDLPRTERSLLTIARGLVSHPKLLVLDEPTASLPAVDVERLFTVLRRLRDTGVGMVYVSHRLDEVYEISTRTVVMRSGAVVAEQLVAQLSHAELVQLIVGHEVDTPTFARPEDRLRLELRDVMIGQVGPISLSVHCGEVLAICGLRGAGQEMIGRVIAGALPIGSGTMAIDGRELRPRTPHDAVDLGIGFATSNRETEAVAPGLSVRENLFLNPAIWGRRVYQFFSHRSEKRDALKQIRAFGVRPADPDLSLDTLSGGNQQKVILARWLSAGRKVIVLEEPTMGVDIGAKSEIYALLRDGAQKGTTVIVISTDMEEVSKICHRAVVMQHGVESTVLAGPEVNVANLVAAASGLQYNEKSAR